MNTMLDKGASASDVSDKIKEILFAKSAEKIDATKPDVAAKLFDDQPEVETEIEAETETEVDDSVEAESEE